MNTKKYFYRNAIFSKQGKKISIIDINKPEKMKELDPWFGMVLQLGDGQHTIEQMEQFMATQYNGNPPPNLNDTLKSVIERMIESKLIVLSENPIEMPYYLSMPFEMMDVEKAKAILDKDKIQLN